MDTIILTKVDDVYMHVECDSGTRAELIDYFTFMVPGYQFMPAYRDKRWDGKIRIFQSRTNTIYGGLVTHIQKFAKDREYEVFLGDGIGVTEELSLQEGKEFIETLALPDNLKIRDYQLEAFVHAVRKGRALLLSPTASGKSLIIYAIIRWYIDAITTSAAVSNGHRALIIVPTKSLVSQLTTDFGEYSENDRSWNADDNIHQIMAGRSKDTNKPIVISTWQSIYKQPKEWFDQFSLVMGDECHLFKAKSLTSIMTKLTNAPYRFGMTGTLDDTQTHQLILEGLFGRRRRVASTKKLIDDKHLAKFDIKAIVLKYPAEVIRGTSNRKYQDEIDFLVGCEKRNNFIRNLAVSLEGNTLVLFNYVEKHGDILYDMISHKAGKDRKVFYVWGGTDVSDREETRSLVESEKDAIIVASSGVFSTGVNIKNLHNIIFTHPGKSKIRVLQSIGRGLRTSATKTKATLYDIVDDMSHKTSKNFAYKHFVERHQYYMKEKFPVKIYLVKLKA